MLFALTMAFLILPQASLPAFAQGEGTGTPTRTTTLDLHDAAALEALASEDGVTLSGSVYANPAQGWSYDASSEPKILTLSGANIQIASASDISYGIRLPADSKIVLAEDTKTVVTAGEATVGSSFAIFAEGDFTIEGSGALEATGGNAAENSYGISSYGGVLNILDGQITALGGEADSSYGIFTIGAITISGGSVNATGGTSNNVGTTGIASEAGGITINGESIITATGGLAKLSAENQGQGGFANSMGIYALGGDVLIDGNAVVNASGGDSENGSTCGIHLNKGFEDGSGGRLTITGDTQVTATGGIIVNMQNTFGGAAFIVGGNAKVEISTGTLAEGENIGVSMTNGYMMLSDQANVMIHAGDGKYGSFGIFLGIDSESAGANAGEQDGKLVVSGGSLEVYSATARNSRAIVAQSDIEITGGSVLAQSGTATEEASTGILSRKAISISAQADVTAQSGQGISLSASISADGGIVLDPALVVLSPEGAGLSANGMYLSAIAGTDGDYATDVHIAQVSEVTTSEPQPEPEASIIPEAEPVSGDVPTTTGSMLWLIVIVTALLCVGGIVFIFMRRKR